MAKLRERKQRNLAIASKIARRLKEDGEVQEDIADIMNRSRQWVVNQLSTIKVDKKNSR